MNKQLWEKIKESLASVLPITLVVLILSMTVVPMPVGTVLLFLAGAVLLILGMGLFTLGVDMSMQPMGEGVGVQISRSKRLWMALLVCLVIGIVVTIAEPDLTVLANQVASIPSSVLIISVAVGVGVFLVVSALRIIWKIPLSYMLIVLYAAVFVLAFFAPREFVAVAFDSGGVTTGPITVPFIMALGVGMAALRSDRSSSEDSFGLIALCSVGPILSVLLLSILYRPTSADVSSAQIPDIQITTDLSAQFAHGFPEYLQEVAVALLPILVLFVIFQLITRRFAKRKLMSVGMGTIYTFLGLVLFLTGANIGFMPIGQYLGGALAGSELKWALIPIGMIIGYFIVKAEPAVHVLKQQVESITNGAVSQKALLNSLSIGVAVSVGLAMLRVLLGIPIFYFLIPGYLIALVLTFFVPRMFTAIAFDSGGVASGPMTATFLLPFAMGSCMSVGGNLMTDAFGVVAMVAMTPLITIQILGFIYARKLKPSRVPVDVEQLADSFIYYEEELADAK